MTATVTHTVGCPEYVTIIRDAALTALGISFAMIDNAGRQRRGKASDCRAIIAYILRKQAYASWNEIEERERIIAAFKAGEIRTLVTKPKILGFGLNLQIATRHVFSGLQDSYEEFYQAVKRSNRYGSTRPLNVHIPITEFEAPMVETVLAKAHRIEQDTREQEGFFREHAFRW